MEPLDIFKFWEDDAVAHEDNCFSPHAKQAALGIRMSGECVLSELGEPGDPWAEMPVEKKAELYRKYNDKAEKTVGIRLLPETFKPADAAFPHVKRIGEVFGGRYFFYNNTEWLEGNVHSAQELEKILDRVDKLDLRGFMFPENWESECQRIYEKYGILPDRHRHIRGPVTLACSIMSIEDLIFLIVDEPELAKRFSDTIANVIIKMTDIMDTYSKTWDLEYFSFADDNCCMLNPEMYEFFGLPVLLKVFERYCPNGGMRYQHSDSAMAHLLPLLSKAKLTGVNFGPTVLVDEIRKHLPNARIDGCMAPYTFMNNDREKIVFEVRRDCEMAKPTRGLNVFTAGSINYGSSLESMKLVMQTIQNYGRYEQ